MSEKRRNCLLILMCFLAYSISYIGKYIYCSFGDGNVVDTACQYCDSLLYQRSVYMAAGMEGCAMVVVCAAAVGFIMLIRHRKTI